MTKEQVESARESGLNAHAERRRKGLLKREAQGLHDRTLDRFRAGEYSPSMHVDHYVNQPDELRHPEFARQQQLIEKNPEHFQGQGKKSRHEMMRVANRQNFTQARVLLSESHMLNPKSGIEIIRHTTLGEGLRVKYEKLLDKHAAGLFEKKKASEAKASGAKASEAKAASSGGGR